MKTLSSSYGSQKNQQGIATVLVVVLVGLALTATSLGIMHSVRSTQEKHVAVHAVTNSQTAVWAGADAFRRYLLLLNETGIGDLNGSPKIDFSLGSDFGQMSADGIAVEDMGGGTYRVSAEIVNKNDLAKSSSALGVTYEVTISSGSTTSEIPTALTFYDDLNVEGAINFVEPTSGSTAITVDGAFTETAGGGTGISDIRATGAVELRHTMQVDRIFTNEDVFLTGSSSADEVYSAKSVHVESYAGVIAANDNIIIDVSYAPVISADSHRGNIYVYKGGHGDLTAGGSIHLGQVGSPASADDVQAKGNIETYNSQVSTNTITSEGNLVCNTAPGQSLGAVSVNGTIGAGCTNIGSHSTSAQQGQSNAVTVIDELAPLEVPPLVVDVWELEDDANFVFHYDSTEAKPKVTVQNINNLPDGNYYLGNYSTWPANNHLYLCSAIDASGFCTSPSTPEFPICLWNSSADCITYDSAAGEWSIQADNTAPGIMLFKGDLDMASLWYAHTSFLVTGDINVSGQMQTGSVNYGDYAQVCDVSGDHPGGDDTWGQNTKYNGFYSGYYPTNLCSGSDYTPIPAGNIGVAAGGYNPDDGGTYSGGDITFGGNSKVWGTVLAGGYLTSAGSSGTLEIFGYVAAATTVKRSGGLNLLTTATNIDLSVATDNYDPSGIPDMSSPASGSTSGSGSVTGSQAKVLWARYL